MSFYLITKAVNALGKFGFFLLTSETEISVISPSLFLFFYTHTLVSADLTVT